MRRILAFLAALASAAGLVAVLAAPAAAAGGPQPAPHNGLAIAPPMGYNDWYADHCGVTEASILTEASELVSTGLAAAGYRYVVVDDCWMASSRTAGHALTWNAATFPDGMPALAAKIHAMGLLFGLYESGGLTTCQGLPGSYDHYRQDVDTFASWGVDFIKLDQCGFPTGTTIARQQQLFTAFGDYIAASGRNMAYSQELPVSALECCGAGSSTYQGAVTASSQNANMWRVALDFTPGQTAASQLATHLADDAPLYPYAGSGHWNDLDFLLAGNPLFGWTGTQDTQQLSIWAEMASPLIISTMIADLPASLLTALENPSMIAIDHSGSQARQVAASGPVEAFRKSYAGGQAVLLFNTSPASVTARFSFASLGVGAREQVTNIWSGTSSTDTGTLTFTVGPSSTALLRLTP
jgi:alpha-galactosidase